jgi:FlaA1/EpsC-like NDP-sugar epimerase
MGATKLLGEYIVEKLPQLHPNAKTLMTCVRFGNVLASRGSVIPLFTSQIELGGPVTVTDFRMARYFMSIPEAASLVIQAACLTAGNDISCCAWANRFPFLILPSA